MALTRPVDVTLNERFLADADYRRDLLAQAVSLLLSGEIALGKQILTRFLDALLQASGEENGVLVSMRQKLEGDGDLFADTLFGLIAEIQKLSGIQLEVHAAA